MQSGNDPKRAKTRRVITVEPESVGFFPRSFRIDENDFKAIHELLLVILQREDDPYTPFIDSKELSFHYRDEMYPHVCRMIRIRDDDEDRRVYSLTINSFVKIFDLPEVVGEMGALEILDIDGPVQKIPPWIGRLKSLRQIKVHWCDGGDRKVPDEIGDLPKLKSFWLLDFTDNHGFSLPSSIGNLAQLRELILADVSALPDEIGNLTRLEYLWVRTSVFTSLPSSIGALQNLKYLIMNVSVPHWIGTLTKLEELRLGGEKITSLPASIGKLVSLKVLSLQNTRNLKGLPDEISNLSNLTTLKLLDSGIASFPLSDIDMSARETKRSFDLYKFLTNFKNLRTLALVNDFFENKFQEKVLLKLVSELPLLSCLGNTKVKDPAIFYSLARNRVRSRILHSNGRTYQDVSFPSLSLWPWIMARARAAFTRSNCREKSCLCGSWDICAISEADAIFLLLVEYGSNFLSLGSDVPQKLLRAGTD